MFRSLLAPFENHAQLRRRIAHVLDRLPHEVQQDFLTDATFCITLEDYTPESGWRMFMACPTTKLEVTRCVVLRSRLEQATEDFANYVIAHEFAHAFLRNGGWGEITDIEQAADALAASWGFERPY
jgi:hypothetical protein